MKDNKDMITCCFESENALYMAYMPFLKNAGLFIRTHQNYALGSCVNLALSLCHEPEVFYLSATVVWITPRGAQGNKPAGVGLELNHDANNDNHFINKNMISKIETYLAGMLHSTQITDTM